MRVIFTHYELGASVKFCWIWSSGQYYGALVNCEFGALVLALRPRLHAHGNMMRV